MKSILPELRVLAVLFTSFVCVTLHVCAGELQLISLPAPRQTGGQPLLDSLKARQTTREFSTNQLSPQILSDLLWAAFGINRPENDHRTAPSAMNSQEVDLYVALSDALYLYQPKPNQLVPVSAGDFRAKTSSQFKTAPVVLVYVADLPRLAKAKPDLRPFYAGFDAGCICQNVYLFCASEHLASVVYDLNRPPLAKAMNLSADQQIIMAQAVGFPLGK